MKRVKELLRRFLIFLLVFNLSIFPVIAEAGNLTVDNSAPEKNRPTLDQAQNGVPVVNLTSPSPGGVSHNKFTDYNVNQIGLILNNSKDIGVSQLGGALYGNPNYQAQGQEAGIVLNEVTGVNRSNLLGYTEMFGKSAEFILANPNGITCNGCGFINMPRVTLGTGAPTFDNSDEFSGLNINKGGDVLIEGLGLDASADYFDIITRAAKINAAIWAKYELSIKTGKGKYDYQTKQFEETDQDASEETEDPSKPEFAIDASLLGSMYAGRIFLVGTEKGVGVSSKSDMLADIDDVVITADGIVMLKSVYAKQNIQVESKSGDIDQTGESIAGSTINYKAGQNINLENGQANAGQGAEFESEELTLTGYDIIAGLYEGSVFSADAKINSENTLIDEASRIIAGGDIIFGSENPVNSLDNKGYIGTYSDFTANISETLTNSGQIISENGIIFNINNDFTLYGGTIYADDYFRLTADNVYNDMDLSMNGSIEINSRGIFENYGSKSIISNNAFKIETGSYFVNKGELSGSSIDIKSGDYITNNSIISGGSGYTIIDAQKDITNYNNSRISSSGSLELIGEDLANNGEISSGGSLTASVNSVSNSEGKLLFSGADMTINAYDYIDNQKGYIYSIGSMNLQRSDGVKNNYIRNYVGYIESQGDMSIYTEKLENLGEDSGSYYITLVERGGYGEGYYALMKENIVTSTMQTDPAYITSGANTYIVADEINNHGSSITSAGDMIISAETLKNETDSDNVYLDKQKFYGKHWSRKKCWGGGWVSWDCRTYHYYDTYWASGTDTAYSANRALIQSGGSLVVAANNVGNEPVNYTSGSGSVSNIDENISFNSAIELPDENDALFAINKTIDRSENDTPSYTYLVETKNEFIDVENFKGSEYLLDRIGFYPDKDVKLIGDAFYDQKIIKDEIFKNTSQRFLSDQVKTDQQQMEWLIENAVKANNDLNLSVGVVLTKEQINALAEPIIWLVEQEVMGEKFLVPKIYIPENILEGFASNKSSTIKGKSVFIEAETELSNIGSIESQTDMYITAGNIINKSLDFQSQIIGKGILTLEAENNITNIGGTIKGGESLSLVTETGDIINETIVYQENRRGDIETSLGFEASIVSDDSLFVNSGNDFTNKGAKVKAMGSASLSAANDINFETLKLRNKTNYTYGNGYAVSDQTKAVGSSLEIGGSMAMNSGQDINFIGSSADIEGAAQVTAGRNFNLLNDYETSYYQSKKTKKGFLSSKTTTEVTSSSTVVDSSFNVGGSTEIKAGLDINIAGSKTEFDDDVILDAKGDINTIAVHDEYYHKKVTKKSGLFTGGSLWGSEKSEDITSLKELHASSLNIIGSYSSNSGGDTNIIGSELNVGGTAQITAGGDFNLKAGYNESFEEHSEESSGFLSASGSLYEKEINIEGQGSTEAVASIINAGNLIVNTQGDALIEGSNVNAENAQFKTEGDFLITSAKEESYTYSFHEKTSVGFDTIAKVAAASLIPVPGLGAFAIMDAMQVKDGRVSVKLAEASYDKEKDRTDTLTQKSSELNIGNQLFVDSGQNITIAGSNVNAGGDIILSAKEDVNIITTQETTKSSHEEMHGTAEISVGVKHQAVEVVNAAKQVKDAYDNLENAKESYDSYKESLAKVKEDYKNGIIDKEDFDDIKADEKYYLANIAMATADLAKSSSNLAQQAAASGTSTSTFGFNFDLQMDIDALVEKSLVTQTTVIGSNITSSSNLIIKAGNKSLIEGSNINSAQSINIAADDVEIIAAKNTYENSYDSKHAHTTVTMSMHGGVSASLSAETNLNTERTIAYTNSHISSSNINITSTNNTEVIGGIVNASDTLTLDVGKDIIVRSLQDRTKSKSQTIGANAGYGNGVTAGANLALTKQDRKEVIEQSGLFAGNDLNVTVGDSTTLKGAVIHSDKQDGVVLVTKTLSYEDIQNKGSYTSFSAGVSFDQEKGTMPTLGMPANAQVSKSTKSAISSGSIITDSSISELSRDTEHSNQKMRQIDTNVIQIRQNLAGEFGEYAFKKVGDYAMKKEMEGDKAWEDGGWAKTVAHAAVGGMQATIGGGNALSGALGAGSREALSNLTADKSDGLQRLASIGIGSLAGAVSGDSSTGASTAFYGEAYNRQLHQKEIDLLKEEKNIEEFADKEGITKEEAEQILSNVGMSMVDNQWSARYNKDTISLYEQAEKFLLDAGKETGAFTATQAEKDNFNMNGFILDANKDFYYKNVSGLGIIAIEKDSTDPYGGVGYVKDNTDDSITTFDKFVTRGANGSVDNGTRKEIAIKEGLYQYDFSRKFGKDRGKPKDYPYIKNLDGTDKIPTETPNQIQGGQSFADKIYVHPMNANAKSITAEGKKDQTGSAGCIGPGKNQDIFRKIYEKTENQQDGMIILIRPDN